MEENTVIVKNKIFNIVEICMENTYKVERKNSFYLYRKFDDMDSFDKYIDNKKIIRASGVPFPVIRRVDKKALSLVEDYIEGENVFDLVYNNTITDKVYEQIFLVSYLARLDKLSLNWDPACWLFTGEKVYYLDTTFINYQKENSFVDKGIYLWFYTKQFESYLAEKGLVFKPELKKDDFVINKEIVLKTVKYYH